MKYKSSRAQGSLFENVKEAFQLTSQADRTAAGSLDIVKDFKAAMAEDLRHASDKNGRLLSRYEVAGAMSELLDKDITKDMLDNWTARSHPHCMRGDFLPAFIMATGGRRTFEVLGRKAGLFVLPGDEALRADIHKLNEEMKDLRRRKSAMERYLTDIGGQD